MCDAVHNLTLPDVCINAVVNGDWPKRHDNNSQLFTVFYIRSIHHFYYLAIIIFNATGQSASSFTGNTRLVSLYQRPPSDISQGYSTPWTQHLLSLFPTKSSVNNERHYFTVSIIDQFFLLLILQHVSFCSFNDHVDYIANRNNWKSNSDQVGSIVKK